MASPATASNPLLYLFLIILLFPSKSMQLCIEKEREALLNVRAGVPDADKQLPPWKGHDCCSWEGVGCNNITGHVVKLYLSASCSAERPGAPAKVHPSLFDLKHLNELELRCNNFSGAPLPELIGSLSLLEHLDLSFAAFSGEIPYQLGNLSNLRYLDLSYAAFSGKIPYQLGNLSNLLYLDLSYNDISQEIPESIGNLKNLQVLDMPGNVIAGAIPGALKHCSKLEVINFSGNNFSGAIPSWIGRRLLSLRVLSLRSNKFTGAIPLRLPLIPSLQVLDLAHNLLSGSLPLHFANFTSNIIFENFDVGNIILIAKDSTLEFTSSARVSSIDLSNNNLFGTIPRELTNLSGLHFLNLSLNHFSGNIPDNIGLMSQLESLDLSNNQLSGGIPPGISALNFLTVLNLSYNNLVGEIPTGSQLQTFTNLSYIGNPKLCGEPLQNRCLGNNSAIDNGVTKEEEDDEYERIWYFIGFAPGFVFGFWAFMAAVMIKKSIRIRYILLIDRICAYFT